MWTQRHLNSGKGGRNADVEEEDHHSRSNKEVSSVLLEKKAYSLLGTGRAWLEKSNTELDIFFISDIT